MPIIKHVNLMVYHTWEKNIKCWFFFSMEQSLYSAGFELSHWAFSLMLGWKYVLCLKALLSLPNISVCVHKIYVGRNEMFILCFANKETCAPLLLVIKWSSVYSVELQFSNAFSIVQISVKTIVLCFSWLNDLSAFLWS